MRLSTTKKKGALITSEPPLPDEEAPPLPDESTPKDDGWSYHWDYNAGAYFFENRFTGQKQWNNPRVPDGIENAYNGSYDRFAKYLYLSFLFFLSLISLFPQIYHQERSFADN